MSKTVIKSFVKTVVAKIKGDDAEVFAEKLWRRAQSLYTAAIPSEKAKLYNFTEAVEIAQENLNNARVNNALAIENGEAFIENVLEARVALEEAQENLVLQEKKIAMLEEELALLQA
jgi:hypothetical protein